MLKRGSTILSIWSGLNFLLAASILTSVVVFNADSPILLLVFERSEIAELDARVIESIGRHGPESVLQPGAAGLTPRGIQSRGPSLGTEPVDRSCLLRGGGRWHGRPFLMRLHAAPWSTEGSGQ